MFICFWKMENKAWNDPLHASLWYMLWDFKKAECSPNDIDIHILSYSRICEWLGYKAGICKIQYEQEEKNNIWRIKLFESLFQ